jgi:hypothetical protein
MSAASQIASAGFGVLLASNGEALIHLNSVVQAVVNRDAIKVSAALRRMKGEGAPDFTLNGWTQVEIAKSVLPTAPESGQSMLDSFGFRHRVQVVFQTDVTWTCFCLVTQAPT